MSESSKRIFKCSGAIVAYLIGSGFASGQEVMQFFTSYGPLWGGLGGLITLVLMTWGAGMVLQDARTLHLEDANRIFRHYCGSWLGTFFEWLSPLFLFGIYVIMLSGAGSLLSEYYGLPAVAGRILMLLLSLGTVLLGLERLTDILGFIGPLIILLVVTVGVLCICANPGGIPAAQALVQTLPMTRATRFWWLSGITYATFCGFTLMPFLAGIGRLLKTDRESRASGMLGSGLFAATALVLSYGMLAWLDRLYDKAVPTVYMADILLPGAGVIFSVVMLAGIYTTAVPMLWSACNKLASDDKSPRFRLAAVVLAAVAFVGGRLPFGTLINIIYPYMGYFGILVFAGVLRRHLPGRRPAPGRR